MLIKIHFKMLCLNEREFVEIFIYFITHFLKNIRKMKTNLRTSLDTNIQKLILVATFFGAV